MANLKFDFLHSYETGERRESEPANAYQYDEGHVLEAVLPSAVTSCEIHYWIRGQEKSEAYTPGSITQNDDGSCTVIGNIPNLYFETNGELRVYIVVTDGDASITTYEGYVHICQRSMPDDYVDDDPENEATRVLIEAQEAAATATAAAQTAQDVADSIPADYSAMSADVDTLKTDVTDLKEEISDICTAAKPNSSSWTVGSLNFPDGNNFTSAARIRINTYITTKDNNVYAFKALTGYEFAVFAWDISSGNYAGALMTNGNIATSGTLAWITDYDIFKNTNYKYRVVLRNASDPSATMTTAESVNLVYIVRATNNDVQVLKDVVFSSNLLNEKQKIQYLAPIDEWEHGYWDGKPTFVSNNSYRCTKVEGLKAGTYYVHNFTEWQSFVQDINTGEIITLHALGLTTNTDSSFTVAFDFNAYITTNQTEQNSKLTNSALPPIYRYGEYGFDGDTYTVEKNGSGDFTSLVTAINYANQFMDSVVYVGAGTWDIIDELGSDYLATVSDTVRGLYLKNRIHVICHSKAKIQANYTGSVANVKKWLSIFNSGVHGFTLENAYLVGSNIRYLIHDERDSDSDAYVNKYLNCIMQFDNTGNDQWPARQCIGGGLGKEGYIEIDGCTFRSLQSYNGTVSYHNSASANAKSHIIVKNCYFYLYNTFRISWYGESTEITTAELCGCYLGADPVHSAENSSAVVENTALVAWNNTVNPHS